MPAPVVYIVVSVVAAFGVALAFKELVYEPHLQPHIARLKEEFQENRRRNRQERRARSNGAAAHRQHNSGESDEDHDGHSDNGNYPLLSSGSQRPQEMYELGEEQNEWKLRRRRGHAVNVSTHDSDEERYGPAFIPRGSRGGKTTTTDIELEDLAPEVREWSRSTLREGNAPAAQSALDESNHNLLFAPLQPSRVSSTTRSPITPSTIRPSAHAAVLPDAEASCESTCTSIGAATPSTLHISSGRLQALPDVALDQNQGNSVLFSTDVHDDKLRRAPAVAQQPPSEASVVSRSISPASETDLSSLITSPPLRPTFPRSSSNKAHGHVSVRTTPAVGIASSMALSDAESGISVSAFQTPQSDAGLSLATPPSHSTHLPPSHVEHTVASARPPVSMDVDIDSQADESPSVPRTPTPPAARPLSQEQQPTHASSPTTQTRRRSLTPPSPPAPGDMPSLSQIYHQDHLDYEHGLVLLSPPSSRSESPFSVLSSAAASPSTSAYRSLSASPPPVVGRNGSSGSGTNATGNLFPSIHDHIRGTGPGSTSPNAAPSSSSHPARPTHKSHSSVGSDDSMGFDLMSVSSSNFSPTPSARELASSPFEALSPSLVAVHSSSSGSGASGRLVGAVGAGELRPMSPSGSESEGMSDLDAVDWREEVRGYR